MARIESTETVSPVLWRDVFPFSQGMEASIQSYSVVKVFLHERRNKFAYEREGEDEIEKRKMGGKRKTNPSHSTQKKVNLGHYVHVSTCLPSDHRNLKSTYHGACL